ncbi:hypothetical protein [Sporomusa sp.]|uniref:hypothetical protein n=1 Tax=Sporomusa sp. TaxID=2078658 RepID=UPI002CBB2BC0|nr:hypothetical protein [Sporomusa sp.]HWR07102.1 hypothetical protein [Sporomusa sp.]
MLQDEIGSIMKSCHTLNPVKIYPERIPQNMSIPSMYFPVPLVSSSGDTFSTYRNSYQLFIKVFACTTQEAHNKAHIIAEGIRKARCVIPVISQAGPPTGLYMRLSSDIQTKELDDGVAQITLKWDSRYPYDREVYQKMGALYLELIIK